MADEDTNEVVPETLEQAEQLTDLQRMKARQEKLSRIAHEIDTILVREDLTWGDWGEIVEMFSGRIGNHVSLTKINSVQ